MKKKTVHSSHLALRFYKHDGWTKEILEAYLTCGRVVDIWPGQEERDYWFLDHTQGSRLDMDRLYAEQVGKVVRWYDFEDPEHKGWGHNESDLAFLKRMNW